LNWKEQNWVHCQSSWSAESSKIKILTSSGSKAGLAVLHDEVRNLIFDDPAEQDDLQRPPREGKLSNPHARAARAACIEKISEISRRASRGRYALVSY
jgi:hypothetical protein